MNDIQQEDLQMHKSQVDVTTCYIVPSIVSLYCQNMHVIWTEVPHFKFVVFPKTSICYRTYTNK